mmetsp:Transcript_19271/g.31154  ORF Transcript_19271/g.31154 Transcript_19271/m.31154 type:complete len:181 (-) Transcript_19271:1689-2231(-)
MPYSPIRIALLLLATLAIASARPIVRHIRSTHEFDRLMKKHATQTGLPVIVDFYSDGCGPCRMIAPIFKKTRQGNGRKGRLRQGRHQRPPRTILAVSRAQSPHLQILPGREEGAGIQRRRRGTIATVYSECRQSGRVRERAVDVGGIGEVLRREGRVEERGGRGEDLQEVRGSGQERQSR